MVDLSVVVAAEQDSVVQIGCSVVEPGFDVVGFGPAWWPVTVWERTTEIPMGEGPSLGRAVESLGATKV